MNNDVIEFSKKLSFSNQLYINFLGVTVFCIFTIFAIIFTNNPLIYITVSLGVGILVYLKWIFNDKTHRLVVNIEINFADNFITITYFQFFRIYKHKISFVSLEYVFRKEVFGATTQPMTLTLFDEKKIIARILIGKSMGDWSNDQVNKIYLTLLNIKPPHANTQSECMPKIV